MFQVSVITNYFKGLHHRVHRVDGWMDGWMGGWVDRVKLVSIPISWIFQVKNEQFNHFFFLLLDSKLR